MVVRLHDTARHGTPARVCTFFFGGSAVKFDLSLPHVVVALQGLGNVCPDALCDTIAVARE